MKQAEVRPELVEGSSFLAALCSGFGSLIGNLPRPFKVEYFLNLSLREGMAVLTKGLFIHH
jgi:hypothetical protein